MATNPNTHLLQRTKKLSLMGVSKNNGTPKPSILIGFSIIFTIHFGIPLFLETPLCFRAQLNIGLTGFGWCYTKPVEAKWGLKISWKILRRHKMVKGQPHKKEDSWVLGIIHHWLVVSTHLKNISQNGNLPQVVVQTKNVRNHHLDIYIYISISTGWPDLYRTPEN